VVESSGSEATFNPWKSAYPRNLRETLSQVRPSDLACGSYAHDNSRRLRRYADFRRYLYD